jgi:hypothetical protein
MLMRRSTLNFVIDAASLLVMVGMVATGLVVRFVLPLGTGGRHSRGPGKALWGMGRHDWGDVHFWLAVATGLVLLVHVALHWAWVCGTVQRLVRPRSPAMSADRTSGSAYGIALLLALLVGVAGFLWIAERNVVTEASGRSPDTLRGEDAGSRVKNAGTPDDSPGDADEDGAGGGWGARTLAEIEAYDGVPAAVIRRELGLPEDVPADERLGRLRGRYDFRMSDVRRIVEEHRPATRPGE